MGDANEGTTHFRWRKPKLCPNCGSRRIATIVWGMPSYELMADVEAGRLVLGGCIVHEVDPSWECLDCRTRVYEARKREAFERYPASQDPESVA